MSGIIYIFLSGSLDTVFNFLTKCQYCTLPYKFDEKYKYKFYKKMFMKIDDSFEDNISIEWTISEISHENILVHFRLKLKYFRGRETSSIKNMITDSAHIRAMKLKSLFPMPNVIYFRWEAFLYPSNLMSENINTWDNDTVIWNFFLSS